MMQRFFLSGWYTCIIMIVGCCCCCCCRFSGVPCLHRFCFCQQAIIPQGPYVEPRELEKVMAGRPATLPKEASFLTHMMRGRSMSD
jgi:hypothetical protein